MNRKGITPIVATVLLITITLAGASTLYFTSRDLMQSQPRSGFNYRLTELNVEQCYNQNSRTHIVVRNGNPKTINVTELGVFVQGAPADVRSFSPQLVPPQESFTINLQNTIQRESRVKLVYNGDAIYHRCLQLD
ncbi:MAG: archaellin/type IV pilin N-terminal domain-containing protein [Candidatus Nanohaloarchaea archaeon]